MRKILERLGIIKPSDQSSEKTSFGTFLKNAFTKNLGAKLLCFFGAIFLWFYVMDNESSIYEYTFKNIKIEYTENNNGMSVLSSGDQTVDVTLSGKRSVIKAMKSSDITAVADISSLSEAGYYNIDIIVRTSNETSVENTDPKSVNVYIDQSTKSNVKVKAAFKGNTGYELELSTYPESIYVTGPSGELAKISHARATVNMGNQVLEKDTTVYGVDLVLYDRNGNEIDSGFMQMSQNTADVDIELYSVKSLPVDPKYDEVDNVFDDRCLNERVLPDKVEVRGRKDIIEGLTSIPTSLIDVEITDLSSKATNFKTGFDLPDGVELTQARNECEVALSVIDYAEKDILVPVTPGMFMNLPKDSSAYVEGGYIPVTVAGVQSAVNQLVPEDIILLIETSGLFVGKNKNVDAIAMIGNEHLSNVYVKELTDGFLANVIIEKNS